MEGSPAAHWDEGKWGGIDMQQENRREKNRDASWYEGKAGDRTGGKRIERSKKIDLTVNAAVERPGPP